MPAGWAWTVAPAEDTARMPDDHFRFVVVEPSSGAVLPVGRLARLLEPGGVLLGPPESADNADGRLRILDRSEDPPLAIVRRE